MERNVFVGLGGNVGDSIAHVRDAIREIGKIATTRVMTCSGLYRTTPVGKLDQGDFINAVAQLETALTPDALMTRLLALESRHGRVRAEKNGPRTLDLDLLLYGDRILQLAHATVPHPRMHERAFVLLPLAEIAPDCSIPGQGAVAALLSALPEQGVIRIDVA